MITGKQLIESFEKDEKLFSTGDSELDDILEEVYYSGIEDGYEYAQKEFAGPKSIKSQKKVTTKFFKLVKEYKEAGMSANEAWAKAQKKVLGTKAGRKSKVIHDSGAEVPEQITEHAQKVYRKYMGK